MWNYKKLLLIIGDIVAKTVASVMLVVLGSERYYEWLWVPALALSVETAFFLRSTLKDRGIATVLRMAYEDLDPPDEEQLRLTLYKVSRRANMLVPYDRYAIPGVEPARMKVMCEQGVAGYSYRVNTMKAVAIGTTFLEEMRKLGFTERQLKRYNKRDERTKFLMGIPISSPLNRDEVLAVLIADSVGQATLSEDDVAKKLERYAPYLAVLLTRPGRQRPQE